MLHCWRLARPVAIGASVRSALTSLPVIVVVALGCRLGFAWTVTFALGLGVVWLWLALLGDYVTRSALKGWRFRSGAWKAVRV